MKRFPDTPLTDDAVLEWYVEEPRTRTVFYKTLQVDVRPPQYIKLPWPRLIHAVKRVSGRFVSLHTFAIPGLFTEDDPRVMLHSIPIMNWYGDNNTVCLGTAAAAVTSGELDPIEAFWDTAFTLFDVGAWSRGESMGVPTGFTREIFTKHKREEHKRRVATGPVWATHTAGGPATYATYATYNMPELSTIIAPVLATSIFVQASGIGAGRMYPNPTTATELPFAQQFTFNWDQQPAYMTRPIRTTKFRPVGKKRSRRRRRAKERLNDEYGSVAASFVHHGHDRGVQEQVANDPARPLVRRMRQLKGRGRKA